MLELLSSLTKGVILLTVIDKDDNRINKSALTVVK